MNAFVQLASQLINSETGGLVYHLILTFSIAGALLTCLNFWNRKAIEWRRLLLGLGLLLLLQISLFAVSALAWQRLVDPIKWLLLLERTTSIIGIIIIVWLWVFPRLSRSADTATLLVGFLVITLAILAGVWWANADPAAVLGNTWVGWGSCIVGMGIIGAGIVFLIRRKPASWEIGLSMLFVLFAGFLFQLVLTITSGDFTTAIRLAELAAYPLLLVLPQRFLVASPALASNRVPGESKNRNELLEQAVASPDLVTAYEKSVGDLASAMQAEICLLFTLTDDTKMLEVRASIDQRNSQPVSITELEAASFPLIVSAMQQGRPLRLPASSNTQDMLKLIQLLQLDTAGHLLLLPSQSAGLPALGAAFLSPLSRRNWSQQDVEIGTGLILPLARFLQQSEHMFRMNNRLIQLDGAVQSANSRTLVDQGTQSKVLDELLLLRKSDSEKQAQLQTLASLVTLQQESLSTANQKIRFFQAELSNQNEGLSREEMDIVSIQVQELHQPLSVIREHAGFLLAESMGVLGAIQRKFIDRIHQSGERALQIVVNLEETLAIPRFQEDPALSEVDIGELMDAAVTKIAGLLRSKRILLRFDLPDNLPNPVSNPIALQQALEALLLRATDVTPSQGQVSIKAFVEEDNGRPDYIILQISDSSGGIPLADVSDIFTPKDGITQIYPDRPIDDTIDLPTVRLLIEKVNGRIWLDNNDIGRGATFSILLPLSIPSRVNGNTYQKGSGR